MGFCSIFLIKEAVIKTELEVIQKNIEEFVQLQNYILLVDKESEVYKVMKIRYSVLTAILTSSTVNLMDIDRIKE